MAGWPRAAGSVALVLADGSAPPGVEAALFEAMLAGWCRQQQSRRLSGGFISRRERVVRRFAVFTAVGADARNKMLRSALARAFGEGGDQR